MKTIFSTKAILLVLITTAALYSCKKDPVAPNPVISEPRTYKDESFGSYTVSITRSRNAPDAGNVFYTAHARGSSTAMTNAKTLCSFFTTTGSNGTLSTGYPINSLLMTDLLNANVGPVPKHVSQIAYDDYGNSIWFQIVSLSIESGSNIRHFSGISNVVGGTGKFSHASGSVHVNGHMSAFNLDDFYIKNEGKITY